jgi:cell division transport system ATP-binding protein
VIELKHVYKTYQADRHTLRDLSLQIEKGEFVFLLGHSGAGKTTLFKTISAFEKASSGEVTVLGYNLAQLKSSQLPFFRRKIGFVFQNYKLLKNRTVRENIELPLVILNESTKIRREKSDELIEKLGLKNLEEQFPDFLSGGEQQRVAVARALIHKPDLIIADEPTGNLDPKLSETIMGVFEEFAKTGATFLLATHDHRLIKKTDCRVLELEKGSLVKDAVL